MLFPPSQSPAYDNRCLRSAVALTRELSLIGIPAPKPTPTTLSRATLPARHALIRNILEGLNPVYWNEPAIRGPAAGPDETESTNAEEHEPFPQAERAVWREQVNQRLYRRWVATDVFVLDKVSSESASSRQ